MADDRPSTSQRVKGHTLRFEGGVCVRDGHGIDHAVEWAWEGSGMCSCGAQSAPDLGTNYARKQWHRTHKADVLSSEEVPT